MTIVFQILAAVTILVAGYFMFRGGGARHQAIQRIMLVVFMAAATSSVFFPQLWTYAARSVGVGRGADLLLYITVLVFLGFIAKLNSIGYRGLARGKPFLQIQH